MKELLEEYEALKPPGNFEKAHEKGTKGLQLMYEATYI